MVERRLEHFLAVVRDLRRFGEGIGVLFGGGDVRLFLVDKLGGGECGVGQLFGNGKRGSIFEFGTSDHFFNEDLEGFGVYGFDPGGILVTAVDKGPQSRRQIVRQAAQIQAVGRNDGDGMAAADNAYRRAWMEAG